jgi:hypothetical protein
MQLPDPQSDACAQALPTIPSASRLPLESGRIDGTPLALALPALVPPLIAASVDMSWPSCASSPQLQAASNAKNSTTFQAGLEFIVTPHYHAHRLHGASL